MKTTLYFTLILLTISNTRLTAQDPCPLSNKMKEGSCIKIEYPSAEAASKAVRAPAETLVISESVQESSNGVYIAQFACSSTEVVYTKAGTCSCTGYEGVVLGTFKFTIGDMTCIYDAAGVLPVEFSYFKAETDKEMALIKWATSSETDNDGFYVEKSTDGHFFQEFAFIVGEGTSTSEIEYETLDRDPFQGMNYYRLKQVDYNGNERYSDIVKLDLRGNKGISVTYNGGSDEVQVRSERKLVSIEIFDMAGVRVHRANLDRNSNEHIVSFDAETTGHFVAVITDENGGVETTKFAKL
jgi:hypothetical protein